MLSKEKCEQAGELVLALSWGYAELSEAINWADSIIIQADDFPVNIFSVSLAKNVPAAIDNLNSLASKANEWEVLRLFFSRFETIEKLAISQALKLSEDLYDRSLRDDAPKELSCFWHHWDLIGLAVQGDIKLAPAEAIKDFLEDIRMCAKIEWTFKNSKTQKGLSSNLGLFKFSNDSSPSLSDIRTVFNSSTLRESTEYDRFVFQVFSSSVDRFCENYKLLNVCVRNREGELYGMRHFAEKDNSHVIDITFGNGTIKLHHWRGFATYLDAMNFKFLKQEFTK